MLSRRAFVSGEVILHLDGQTLSEPDRHTLQVGAGVHLDAIDAASGKFYAWRYLNHSCQPNAAVRDRELVALRAIAAGDEITFDYNTTEYDMASPFQCHCGSAGCAGKIRGYRYLTAAERARIRPDSA